MRDLIKIIFALAFMAGAFWVGEYMEHDKHLSQIKEMNTKSEADNRLILQLRDSIGILKTSLENEKINKNADTIKPRLAITPKKR